MKTYNIRNNNRGFTHFEFTLMIIFVAIIAVTGLYVFNYQKNKSKAESFTPGHGQKIGTNGNLVIQGGNPPAKKAKENKNNKKSSPGSSSTGSKVASGGGSGSGGSSGS
ncbi:MAG: hypothetical protein WCP56_03875, partial [Candidatus Saccharibacteria bacterium]